MVTIADIDRAITELIPIAHPSRPFLCEGSPLGCRAAIVGINPGTKTELKSHWKLPHGCNRNGWIKEFESDPLNSRKTTRPCIEKLMAELAPIRCLELNLYPYYSPTEDDLEDRLKDARFFEFILDAVKPRVMYVFGKSAIEHLRSFFRLKDLPRGEFIRHRTEALTVDIYADSHFSWYAKQKGGPANAKSHAQKIGHLLKEHLLANCGS